MPDRPRLCIAWSGPRNVSTALMYSFAQRKDTRVWDEPFFGHFLHHTGVWRPSREEVLQTMELDPVRVLEALHQPSSRPVQFLKNMASHTEGLALETWSEATNFILVRHPAKVLASYTRHVEQPTAMDLGYQHQWQLLQFLKKRQLPYYVVDSDAILLQPEQELRQLCTYLGLTFTPGMLRWPAGARPEDGVWAKYWYHNVHRSTGFSPPSAKPDDPVPDHLQELLARSLSIYHQLKNYEQV